MEFQSEKTSPLIVVGMHRSGTRLLAQVLERLGVFMGADQQADSESLTFMRINEGILHQCGAFWSEPMSAHFILSQPQSAQALAEHARNALTSQFANYAGSEGWQGPNDRQFGWKDPRNTFTLPVWREIFPGARAIHIVRHGIDVAVSLARRHHAALQAAAGSEFPGALTVVQEHGSGVLSSRRGWTLPEALTMWEQYVEKARLELASMSAGTLEIRFEELLATPEKLVPAIAQFCGAELPPDHGAWFDDIRSDRAFAFRRDATLSELAKSAEAALNRFGYSA